MFDTTANAFGQPARNLPLDQRTDFFVGNALFNRNWVTAPSSTVGSDGLGPLFNAALVLVLPLPRRPRPPAARRPTSRSSACSSASAFRATDTDGGPLGEPELRRPAQPAGHPRRAAGRPRRSVDLRRRCPAATRDGEPYSLRVPAYDFVDLAFGPLDPDVRVSPRIAPFIIGLGLLGAVDEATILDAADPGRRATATASPAAPTASGIAAPQAPALGRFGWKANQPTVEQQNAGAFLGDIGITSPLFPEQNCTRGRRRTCRRRRTAAIPRSTSDKIDSVTFYTRLLAVPGAPRRRRSDRARAASSSSPTSAARAATSDAGHRRRSRCARRCPARRIHPYTDLLLHDMGADLADERPDFEADGREWRTPPLWGIGLVEIVNRHTLLPARRPRPRLRRGDPLARRRSRGGARGVPHAAERRSRRADPLPGVAVIRRNHARTTALVAMAALVAVLVRPLGVRRRLGLGARRAAPH